MTDQALHPLVHLASEQGWRVNLAGADSELWLVLAHGAGAPMDSPFMEGMAQRLADAGIHVVRFEFPYMAQRRAGGGKRPPDPQARLLQAWRDVYQLIKDCHDGRLVIGGKSMGGRMASLLADELNPAALVCLGYPFHPAGKPEKTRVAHLEHLVTPTLIVQGERDPLGDREQVSGYRLAPTVDVHWICTANHDLKPLKASGLSEVDAREQTVKAIVSMLASL